MNLSNGAEENVLFWVGGKIATLGFISRQRVLQGTRQHHQ